jgi:hypothetical protein
MTSIGLCTDSHHLLMNDYDENECRNCGEITFGVQPRQCGRCYEATDGSVVDYWPAPEHVSDCNDCGVGIFNDHETPPDINVWENKDSANEIVNVSILCGACYEKREKATAAQSQA